MEEDLERIVVEEEKPQEIFLEFNKPTFNHSVLKKGWVLTVREGVVYFDCFYRSEVQKGTLKSDEFYPGVKNKDLFVVEEKSAEEYLVERAEKYGKIVSNKDNFLTLEPEDLTKQRLFFYFDKATQEKRKLDCRQFGAGLVLEGKPKEGELVVVRQGKIMKNETIKPFAYLAVYDALRESYLLDQETNSHKRLKNFCNHQADY